MITDDRAYALFVAANPAPDVDRPGRELPDAAGYLATLRQRSSDMTQVETIPETKPPSPGRGWLMAAAVAAVAIIVVIGVMLTNGDEVVDQPVPTTVPVEQTTVAQSQALSEGEALSASESLLTAYSSSDFEGFLAQFTAGATYEDTFVDVGPIDAAGPGLAWYITQGTELVNPQCSVTSTGDSGSVVECVTDGTVTAVNRAAGVSGVPTTVTITVSADGVEAIRFDYGLPDFATLSEPFDAWMAASHPEVTGAVYADWTDTASASTDAQTRAEYAGLWADFAVNAVEATFADYNAGDLDAFLGHFGDNPTIWSAIDPGDVPALTGSFMAHGDQLTLTGCHADGIRVESLWVLCDIGDSFTQFAGIRTTGQFRLAVGPDGGIVEVRDMFVYAEAPQFYTDFEQWMAETYPTVHDSMQWIGIPIIQDLAEIEPYYTEFLQQSDKYPLGG